MTLLRLRSGDAFERVLSSLSRFLRSRTTDLVGFVYPKPQDVELGARLADCERDLALLMEHTTEALLRLDRYGRCTYASPSVRRIFGVDPSFFTGKHLVEELHQEDRGHAASAFRKLVAGKLDGLSISLRYQSLTTPGKYHWLAACFRSTADAEAGRPIEICVSLRNIDEVKELEEELADMRNALLRAEQSKKVFLANMSHELRTPMNGLLGFTDRALATAPDEQFRKNLEKIAGSGRIMLGVLNNLLDTARIDSGHMQIVSEPTDLRDLMQALSTLVEPSRCQKGLPIHMEIAESVPAWFLSDPQKIRQILLNLLGNALKFTDAGEITVRADVDTANSILELSVSDTGIGISEDQLQHIFEDFVQAETTVARRFEGTGLGLSISMELARMLGGSLSAQSSLAEGSTFLLKLPLFSCEGPASAQDRKLSQPATSKIETCRVLVVEDNDINQALISGMLEDAGIDYELAGNGREGVERVLAAQRRLEDFDLVLMDVRMPVLDGLGATREIRQAGIDCDKLPIIALTAHAYRDDIRACHDAGMQAHMAKPFQPEALLALMAEHLAKRRPARPDMARQQSEACALVETKYAERKETARKLMRSVMRTDKRSPESFEELAQALHQLAATAGFFGERELGIRCMRLESDLAEGASALDGEDFTRLAAALGGSECAPLCNHASL